MTVAMSELHVLSSYVQLSLAQHLADPVTCNQQWSVLAGQRPFTMTLPLPHAAVAILISPIAACLIPALYRALALKPAVLICYAPVWVLPAALSQFLESLKLQHRAASFKGIHGWWLVISRPPLPVANWLP